MLYAVGWFVIAVLLSLWSLLAWALHALASWVILAAGALPGAVPSVESLKLPDWLAPWIPPETVSSVVAWLSGLGPFIERLFQAAPILVDGLGVVAWLVWGLGAALLLLIGAGLHVATALWRRRPGPRAASSPAYSAIPH